MTKLNQLVLSFLFTIFLCSSSYAGNVIIYQKVNGQRQKASSALTSKYRQLSKETGKDIWVFFYDQISSSAIADQTRLTRNELGLGRPNNVIIIGVTFQPKKKLFVDYFEQGSPNSYAGKALFDFIRQDFKRKQPQFNRLPSYVHTLLYDYLISIPQQKKEKELARLEQEKAYLLESEKAAQLEQKRLQELWEQEEVKRDELQRTEEAKREEFRKTEESKRLEAQKTEEAKRLQAQKTETLRRKLLEEEAKRNEPPVEIPWLPIGIGVGGITFLISLILFLRRRMKYLEVKKRLLVDIKKEFDRFVDAASETRELLEFGVAENLGVLSINENKTDRDVVEMLSTKYYDYQHYITYNEYDFNQHWFKEIIGYELKFKPFDAAMGLQSLHDSLQLLKSDRESVIAIAKKNKAFVKYNEDLNNLLEVIEQKELLLPTSKSSIEKLHQFIAHCPIAYLPIEQALFSAKTILLNAQYEISLDQSIKMEVTLMKNSVDRAWVYIKQFEELLAELKAYQLNIERIKEDFAQDEREVNQQINEIEDRKVVFDYLPNLNASETIIYSLQYRLTQLKANTQKNWEGEEGLIDTMALLREKVNQLLKEFDAFKAAKDELPHQQQQIKQNHEIIGTWHQQYPQLPEGATILTHITQHENSLNNLLQSSNQPNWFQVKEYADSTLLFQKKLLIQFAEFKQAENQHLTQLEQSKSHDSIIMELEQHVGLWESYSNQIQQLKRRLIGDNFFELVVVSQKLNKYESNYITHLTEQKEAKEQIVDVLEKVETINYKAKQLRRNPYLISDIPYLGIEVSTFKGNYVTHLKQLITDHNRLEGAFMAAKNEIHEEKEAERYVKHYASEYQSLARKFNRLKNSRYAWGSFISKPSWPQMRGSFVNQQQVAKRLCKEMEDALDKLERHISRKKRKEREEEERRNSSSSFGISSSSNSYDARDEDSGFSGGFSNDDDDW